MEEIKASPLVPTESDIYCNGFVVMIGGGDIIVQMHHNGKIFSNLNLSFTLAKTLGEALVKTIGDLEAKSGQKIMTNEEIVKALAKNV